MFWLLLAAIVAVVLVHLAAAVYIAEMFTRSKRRRVEGTPGDFGLRYEEVQFSAPDGIPLRGWYLESPGARATVVVVHDVDGTRADRAHGLLALQRDYLRRGFNVLAFDLRGRGESGGARDHLGSLERLDVIAGVDYARTRAAMLPVIVHGFGLGGSLAIVQAADGLQIDLVIADSPFTTARAYLRKRWMIVPGYMFFLACHMARRMFRADVDTISPLAAICAQTITAPILFIHGESDRIVPIQSTYNLAGASLNPHDQVWKVPGAGHCMGYLKGPDAYMRRCLNFIDTALPTRRVSVAVAG